MRAEFHQNLNSAEQVLSIYFGYKEFSERVIEEAVKLATEAIATKWWEDNKTQIMAQVDLKGLATMIVLKAHEELIQKNTASNGEESTPAV